MKYDFLDVRRKNYAGDFTIGKSQRHYAPDLKLEPIHTELFLDLDLQEKSVQGRAIITLKSNTPGTHRIDLDAVDFENVVVESLSGLNIQSHYDDKRIRIEFGHAFKQGEETQVQIHYAVVDPITGIGFKAPSELQPRMPLAAISDNETERARYWFPCVDFPTIRSRMEYHITAQKDLTILANGSLVEELVEGDRKTAHWKLDYPCPAYLACIAAGDFSEYHDEPLDGMPIAYFADKSYTPEQLQRTFGQTRDMLIWMQAKLGMKFPFPKYFQLAGREVGGAMENISLVTWDDKFMLDETMAREWQYIMDLINVHEMSHSYFGDAVVSYDFAHVWLKESWATYIESVWLEDSQGTQAMHWQMAEESRSYMSEVKERYARPIITREYDHSWNMFDMHLYPGGAWRLHMLRHLVGDDAFWAGVREYVNSFAGKTVKSIDFQRCIENHSALNLDSFFDTWFKSRGYPKLDVSFEYDSSKKKGKFFIKQTQVDEEKGIGIFDLPLDIKWQDESGKDHRTSVMLGKAEQVLVFDMEAPAHLSLDPDMKALFEVEFKPGDDRLRHLLKQGQTVREKMQALSALAKTGKRKNLQAIRSYLDQEAFWGLRIHAYRCLAEVQNQYAFDHLAALLLEETHPMVLEAAADACGKRKASVLRESILKKLKSKDLPYRGEMALLGALGAQQNTGDIALLQRYSKQENWRNLVKAGAFTGLGAMQQEAVLDTLLEGVERPVHFFEEKVARISALADLHGWLPRHLAKRVELALSEATGDPSYPVQINAAKLIGGHKLSLGLDALKGLKQRLADQDHPLITRQLRALESGAEGSLEKKYEKQLNQLKEQIAGMEKRLQEVEAEKD